MKYLIVCVTVLVLLSGCTSLEYPEPKQSTLDNNHVLTTTSGQGQIYVMQRDNNHYLCSLPQPDAAFDQKDGGNIDVSLISTGGEKGASTDEDSEEVELAGRTPTVLMTRELFFRACEFSSNYQLSKDEAKALYMKTLDGVLANWAIEAGHTTVTIGDTVDNKAAISNQKTEQSSTTLPTTDTSKTTTTGIQSY
ncbi:hypothetical protein P2G88_18950 [Aliiglaciecola sp. CAU 1673]|uniref:hypothetical protein n=1 Tax=Aliiglaciecola sp. CAU 1673 TaxID=3032595 RepID=UPI0023DBCAE5|nr:hypothetical protein [Aliiglaciecola sp. CAU 1673]MDF2180341.1 hypothetical protein [Aliiglaciecola sp. CAU 1673]